MIDPGRGIDRVTDLTLRDGRVEALEDDVDPSSARTAIDAAGALVVPGLIDLHTHVYWGATSLSVAPEPLARRSATTTLVDAGSAGPGNFHGFRAHVIEPSPVRILAFLNLSHAGIFAFSPTVMAPECADLRLLEQRDCLRAAQQHQDLVVGIKVRVGRNTSPGLGAAPLDLAIEVAADLGLPVMAHIDFPPPTRAEVLERLRPGDILTHCYRPFPNAPDLGRAPRREMVAARERGILFDIGHGMGGFGFEATRAMLQAGMMPDVISSDVHVLSEHGPAFDNLVTMSKLLCLGMPLVEVIRAATIGPAEALGRPELGTLAPGSPGDVAVLGLESGTFGFVDTLGEQLDGDERLTVRQVVVGGRLWHDATKEVPA